MYIPAHFQENRIDVLHEFIRAQPFATLITQGPQGMIASHVPLLFDSALGPMGTLRGHLALGNPQWKEFSPDASALAIFQGPHHYISPSWLPSKDEHGKVVPTWNYVAVHAYGKMRIVEEPARLLDHLHKLTDSQEAGNPERWHVDDAPPDYIERLSHGIAGIEIEITKLEGKWKVSQNRTETDRHAIIARLRQLGTEDAAAMAALVEAAL